MGRGKQAIDKIGYSLITIFFGYRFKISNFFWCRWQTGEIKSHAAN